MYTIVNPSILATRLLAIVQSFKVVAVSLTAAIHKSHTLTRRLIEEEAVKVTFTQTSIRFLQTLCKIVTKRQLMTADW